MSLITSNIQIDYNRPSFDLRSSRRQKAEHQTNVSQFKIQRQKDDITRTHTQTRIMIWRHVSRALTYDADDIHTTRGFVSRFAPAHSVPWKNAVSRRVWLLIARPIPSFVDEPSAWLLSSLNACETQQKPLRQPHAMSVYVTAQVSTCNSTVDKFTGDFRPRSCQSKTGGLQTVDSVPLKSTSSWRSGQLPAAARRDALPRRVSSAEQSPIQGNHERNERNPIKRWQTNDKWRKEFAPQYYWNSSFNQRNKSRRCKGGNLFGVIQVAWATPKNFPEEIPRRDHVKVRRLFLNTLSYPS
jgi:hypothetical protein